MQAYRRCERGATGWGGGARWPEGWPPCVRLEGHLVGKGCVCAGGTVACCGPCISSAQVSMAVRGGLGLSGGRGEGWVPPGCRQGAARVPPGCRQGAAHPCKQVPCKEARGGGARGGHGLRGRSRELHKSRASDDEVSGRTRSELRVRLASRTNALLRSTRDDTTSLQRSSVYMKGTASVYCCSTAMHCDRLQRWVLEREGK